MGKQPLKRLTIAVTGDFGEQRSVEQMRRWIHVNGGTFAYDVSAEVTHLVCSKEHFKKSVTMVQKARQLRTVKIVSWDWLEDTLMKEHPMKESEYLLRPLVKVATESKEKKKAVRKENIRQGLKEFEKGCQEFKNDMFSDGYHIYRDSTTFPYDITLARTNLLINRNDRFALKVCHPTFSPSPIPLPPHKRHLLHPPILTTPIYPTVPLRPRTLAPIHHPRAQRLQLYESHATPKYYACYAKYSSPGVTPTNEMLAPIGSSWEGAWEAFRGFFKLKTGGAWEERLGKTVGGGDGFRYAVPKGRQPKGVGLDI
ncbi:hypothetical protein BDR22DRAFT_968894 [Usnea florida]